MKVLQIVTTLAHGGAQATVLASCVDLPPDVEVVVVSGPDDTGEGSLRGAFEAAGVRVVEAANLRRRVVGADEARALADLVRILRAERPDVVHTHSSKAGALGRVAAVIAGVPVIHTVHGWSFNGRGRPAAAAIVAVERSLARLAVRLVVVSEADAERGRRHRIGTGEHYSLVRAGIDVTAARAAAADREAIRGALGIDPSTFVVGTVARLDRAKDVPALVDGFAGSGLATGGARLVVVGDGAERPLVDAAIERHGLGASVDLLGHRPDGDRLVAAFDCFALASRWEGLPRALVEAMAAGVPVVATTVGGIPRLLGGDRGVLVAPGAPAELALALRGVHDDPQGARSRADRAAAVVGQFSVETMRAQLLDLWRDAAGGRQPAGSGAAPAGRPLPAG